MSNKKLEHVVILGLGPSLEHYVDVVKRVGNRHEFADEVWAINSLGDVLQCDRIFHMDDVRVQERRAEAKPQSNIANMLRWIKTHPGPIYTSQKVAGYPGLVEYPLEDVVNALGYAYFNNTAPYALAYAIYLGVKKISIFGCDYTYPNSHDAEKGRGCMEFWLGIAAARGITIAISDRSTLMDSMDPPCTVYGYDMVDVSIEKRGDGTAKFAFSPKEGPSADEIEERYDHSRPTNILVERGYAADS